MDPIWYCFYRSSGEFAGSGITEYDTPEVGSTLVPVPDYDEDGPLPVWDGNAWSMPES